MENAQTFAKDVIKADINLPENNGCKTMKLVKEKQWRKNKKEKEMEKKGKERKK